MGMAHLIFYLIVLLVIIDFAVAEILKYLNNRSRKASVPGNLTDVYSTGKYQTYIKYKRETYRFSVYLSLFTLALNLLMLFGGFRLLDELTRSVITGDILHSLAFFAVIGFVSDILTTPFDVYSTFVIEEKYGFNTTTPRTYVLDKLKGYLLALTIGLPVGYFILWLYKEFGSSSWWMAWVVVSVLSLVMSLLYSNIIVPLFNKQTPLEEGQLKDEIEKLAVATGFRLDKVFVIDGSKRSTRANAYFTGLGAKKRIVLYDTLIQTMSTEEIVAVLAHEIGHYKKKHTIMGLVGSIITTGIILFLWSLIIDNPLLSQALGTIPSFHIGTVVFIILFSPLSFVLSFFTNYISRKHEFQADRYAAENASGDALINALKSLTSNNMSDLTPHPWYVKAYYSHPPLAQRMKAIKA